MSIQITLDANLQETRVWDASNPARGSQFSHSATVYTADGQQFALLFFYTLVGDRVWEWHVLPEYGDSTIGSGELEFDDAGRLIRSTVNEPLRVTAADGSLGQPITVDFGGLASEGASDPMTAQTSLGPKSGAVQLKQDGHAAAAWADCR